MSIASEITRLQNIKTNIRSALVTQGVPAASGHDMADFSADILSISTGGGATIIVTYSSEFYNKTMTCTKGTTTYTQTTTSSGSTTFSVAEGGTWTITCNGVSRTVDVVLEYTTSMAITLTIDVYSAASDTVSFTDITGAKTVTTNASGQGSVSITFIPDSTIKFTSSIAKNPSNLSQAYSKTITMISSITSIYVMPNGTLYWYGYMDSDTEFTTTSNGWANSTPYNEPPLAPTQNTNNIYGESFGGGRGYSGFASKTSKTYSNNTVHFIGSMAKISPNTPQEAYPYVGILGSKSGGSITADMPIKDLFTDEHRTGSITGTGYLTACTNCAYVTSITIKALWLE